MGYRANQISPEIRERVHQDYITTDLSLRSVAKKHGLSFSTVRRWASEELWSQEKDRLILEAEKKLRNALDTQTNQYTGLMAERRDRIYSSADKLLDKVNMLLELDEPLCPKDLKSISSTLLDLKLIHNIKDESEQDSDKVIRVVFDDWEDS